MESTMASADFFTRLVALNAVGPNVLDPGGAHGDSEVTQRWVCGNCEADYSDKYDAQACCPPDVFQQYKCPRCDALYDVKDEAASCCSPFGIKGQPMQCPVCMIGADSFEIAADCCLHTHPTMTALGRRRVAELVESGVTWAEAIAQNVNH
jgi:hypothetical protein